MHTPAKFKETDTARLSEFIEVHPLGTLVVSAAGELNANHLPFHLVPGEPMRLQSHIAKANSLWKQCQDGDSVLLIFHGPNAYVSPNYYPSKKVAGKAVPTWNYSVVHVRGKVFFKHEGEWILSLLNRISNQHEAEQAKPWQVSDAPADYIEKLANAVVGVEVVVEEMLGQFKLSQNKTEEDYAGVVEGLSESANPNDQQVAEQMRK
ncbi:MAG: FMN-binding negative transcriptional regulator [Pontibacterium sp.]